MALTGCTTRVVTSPVSRSSIPSRHWARVSTSPHRTVPK
jgi:hypothetical protein